MRRKEIAKLVSITRNSRHDIACSFTPKIFNRKGVKVGVGFHAQACADAFTHPAREKGSCPFKYAGCCACQRQQSDVIKNRRELGQLALLHGNEHIIRQRHDEVGRNQAHEGRNKGQEKSKDDQRHLRLREFKEPKQHL